MKTIYVKLIIVILILTAVGMSIGYHTPSQKILAEQAVITPTLFIKPEKATSIDTSSWKPFTDATMKLTLLLPENVLIDKRQTAEGRILAFVFMDDKNTSLAGAVPVLYVADTKKTAVDGFTVFRTHDCGKSCEVSYTHVSWVNLQNAYGIKNPNKHDVANYFLTNKEQTHSVINLYVGNYTKKDKTNSEKMAILEQIIQTVQFE